MNDNDIPDEDEIIFAVSDLSVNEGEQLEITIQAIGTIPTGSTVELALEFVNGTAESGIDFNANNETISFTGTDAERTITLDALTDDVEEADEDFLLVLNPSTENDFLIFDGTQAREGTIVNVVPEVVKNT